jgi:DNA-binding MarR family transcriptional regulator
MATERRRSTPTADELAAWREYLEAGERLRRALAAGMTGESGISPADYEVLLALSEADGRRLRSSALAEKAGWERSRLSHHLARMERRGLIAREECLTDNRGAEVVITDEGLHVFRRSSAAHLALVRRLFVDALTPEQLASAQQVSAAIRTHLEEQQEAG